MSALRWWIAACLVMLAGNLAGLHPAVVILASAPFALLAGWHLTDAPSPKHTCGWCGRKFNGPYEWVCPRCEGEARNA